MLNFLIFNPWGETFLLLLLVPVVLFAHRRGWIEGGLVLELVALIGATILGFFLPGVFFFLAAVGAVVWRIVQSSRRKKRREAGRPRRGVPVVSRGGLPPRVGGERG